MKTKSCKRDSKQWGHLTAPSSLRFRCHSSRLVKSLAGLLHLILKGLAEVVLIDWARRRGCQQRAALESLRALKRKTFLGNRFREPRWVRLNRAAVSFAPHSVRGALQSHIQRSYIFESFWRTEPKTLEDRLLLLYK